MGSGARDRDQSRAERQQQFSRRELVRAGMALPVVLSLPVLLSACGGGGSVVAHGDHTDTAHHDAAHTDSVHADTTHSDHGHGDAVHNDTGGETPTTRRSTHSDTDHGTTSTSSTTVAKHADTAHVDTPHADMTVGARVDHDDSGKHADYGTFTYSDTAGPPHTDGFYTPGHVDSGPHADTSTPVPAGHADTPHGDTAHSDSAHSDTTT